MTGLTRSLMRICLAVCLLSCPVACGGATERSTRLLDLAAQAPAEQRAAFADDRIDDAEYEAAIDRTIACLGNNGYPATKQHEIFGLFSISVEGASDSDEADREYDRCSDRFKTQIESRVLEAPPSR